MKDIWFKELNQLISSAKDGEEAGELLKALLTPAEYEEIAARLQIVKLLREGETQRAIRDRLGVSIATVTRGSRELKYGNGTTLDKFFSRVYQVEGR